MEEKIKRKIAYLEIMARKYNELGVKNYWRVQQINIQVEALENVLNNVNGEWDECYEEDLKDMGKS